MRVHELQGPYRVLVGGAGPDSVVAEVRHLSRNRLGGSIETPIGHIAAAPVPAEAEVRAHWRAECFLRADVAREMLDSELPDMLADWLLSDTACAEPLVLNIYQGHNTGFVTRGPETWLDD